jgi:YjbE family integral membrane protein
LDLTSPAALFALTQILMINIVLSGDNAVVIGMVAARSEPSRRSQVILWGMAAAVIMRVIFALFAVTLLEILGLLFLGGVVLLWVAWRLYCDIREHKPDGATDGTAAGATEVAHSYIPFRRAIGQIAVADLSMSIDNVLAIAGAANENLAVLVIGLVVSIAMMGVAANFIARLLQRFPMLAYVGVVLILYVAAEMIWEGAADLPELWALILAGLGQA